MMITDPQYRDFLLALAVDQQGKNPLILPDWERNFLASFTQSSRPGQWFTEGRRKSTDKMWRKWGAEIKLPHPEDRVPDSHQIPPADPGCCEYLVRADGRQGRCNEPATHREPGRLRYCQTHADQVQRAIKQSGRSICLIPFQPADTAQTTRANSATPSRP